jgi:HlyD family secretion protein
MLRAVVLVVLVIVGGAVLSLVQPGFFDQQVSTHERIVQDEAVVTIGDLVVAVNATGSISPIRQASLAFEYSSTVAEILVQEGQSVKAGQVLARLSAPELQNALRNAEIALASQQVVYDALTAEPREVDIALAQAALTVAQAQASAASLGPDANQLAIAQLQAELSRNQLWQAQLQRDLQTAYAQQAVDQAAAAGISLPAPPNPGDDVTPQIIQAENSVQLADVNAAGVQNQGADVAALAAANAQIVSAQIELDRLLNGPSETELLISAKELEIARLAVQQAELTMNRALLTVPFDGVIWKNDLVVGEIPPQGAAMQLIDASLLVLDVAVDETDIVDVQIGQQVKLSIDALPGAEVSGQVIRVAITPVQTGQLVTYTVGIVLDKMDETIRIGMTATATIIVNELQDVLTLPNRFIRIDRTTQQAYVAVELDSGIFVERPVVLGVRNETDSQIVSGLRAGERVVLVPRGTFNPIEGT